MTQLVPNLQAQLDKVLRLVEGPSLLALSPREGRDLREQALALSQKLVSAESEPLTIGLLGGTGVGKSTILNALAGSEISAASHRRPWTDHVLIYRHEEARGLPPERLNGIPWQEFTHNNASIGKILLCDLPDFDSIQTEHRDRVLDFLEHLDLLVWVASPEKYADQKFHDFLAAVPKAQQNFFFVLNKLDLMFEGRTSEKGYEAVSTMSRAFQKRLRENGVSDPLIFLVSAKDGKNGQSISPWNQFLSLKKQVFQERRLKEVMAIKATNLDIEIHSLIRHVGKGMKNLEAFETVLAETTEQLQSQRMDWQEEWRRVLEGWIETHVRTSMRGQRPDPAPLLGPGYGLGLLMDTMRSNSQGTEETSLDLSTDSLRNEVCSTFEIHLQWIEARMDRQLLHHSLPDAFGYRTKTMIRHRERLENLNRALSQTLTWHMGRAPWPSFLGFKIWQGTCYVMVLAVFLLAIGGKMPWQSLLDNPGVKNLAHLILSGIHTLFSAQGLAALGTYIVLNLFLGFRFYRRLSRLLQQIVDKRVAALATELTSAWESQLNAVVQSLNEGQKDVQDEKLKIASLMGSKP
jgi:GTP-binding protein EngB required for normal cell division